MKRQEITCPECGAKSIHETYMTVSDAKCDKCGLEYSIYSERELIGYFVWYDYRGNRFDEKKGYIT